MTYQFAEHQQYGKFMMQCNPFLGCFYAMGTGKTAMTLDWINDALKKKEIGSALVVCPASLVDSWETAIDEMILFEGYTDEDVKRLRSTVRIRSFQRIYRAERTTTHHRDGRTTTKRTISLREDVDREWGVVIVDEAHGIGAHNSVQTRAAITLGKLAKHRYILTATPVHGGGGKEDFSKLYGEFQFLSGGTMWKSWSEFCSKYVLSVDKWYKPLDYDVEACRSLMKQHAIVCRLEDCFDMPGKMETEIKCKLAESKMYKDIRNGNLLPYGIDVEVAGAQYIKLMQICSGSMKRERDTMILRCSKDDVLEDILTGTDDPVVIFCNFRASVDRCATICRKVKRKCTTFDGRSQPDVWKQFSAGKTDVIICQYQSGGVGLNLQRAHIMVLFEPCTSALLLEQATGRIYRKGQDKKCIYYYLVTPGSIEKKILDTVRSGVDVSNAMLNEWSALGII